MAARNDDGRVMRPTSPQVPPPLVEAAFAILDAGEQRSALVLGGLLLLDGLLLLLLRHDLSRNARAASSASVM